MGQFMAQFFGGLAIGFYKAWDVALVAMCTGPLVAWGICKPEPSLLSLHVLAQ